MAGELNVELDSSVNPYPLLSAMYSSSQLSGDALNKTISGLVNVEGNLTLTTSAHIKGGQTGYNTGTGFFLGYDSGYYKLSIGNPSSNHLIWSGTALSISGSLTASSIHIPDQDTTANSFHTDTNGNSWWGCSVNDFETSNDNANAFILNSGGAKFQDIILEGSVILKDLQSGSVVAGQYVDALSVGKLSSGTITSKTITLSVTDGTGDSCIAAGKTDFDNTVAGFILGIDDSDSDKAKFYIGDANTYLNWTGSALNIGGTGVSININNAATIDSSGNIVASSLRRRDVHWLTFFESVDGYSTGGVGTEVVDVSLGHLQLQTGGVTNNTAFAVKYFNSAVAFGMSWDKQRSIKIGFSFLTPIARAKTVRFGMGGQVTSDIAQQIGFFISNETLYGYVADGSSYDLVSYGTITSSTVYDCEARSDGAGTVEFFVNGTSIGTLTTNVPIGTNFADTMFSGWVRTDEDNVQQMAIYYCDFWQAE